MKTVNISALKNTLINEGIYLTAWVRQKTTQTKVRIKQKQIYFEGSSSSTMVEAVRGKVNDLQLVACCNLLKKHLRTDHLFMRNPPLLERCRQRKKNQFTFLAWCAVHAFNEISGFVLFFKLKNCFEVFCYKFPRTELKSIDHQ